MQVGHLLAFSVDIPIYVKLFKNGESEVADFMFFILKISTQIFHGIKVM